MHKMPPPILMMTINHKAQLSQNRAGLMARAGAALAGILLVAIVLLGHNVAFAQTATQTVAQKFDGADGQTNNNKVFFRPIPAREPGDVRIGVLAFRGAEHVYKQWQPLSDYLSGQIPERKFTIVPLSLSEVESVVSNKAVDFILTNPGNYASIEAKFGVTRIATLQSENSVLVGNFFGATIFTRSDRADIKKISDLKGKSFMAIGKNAFGGFQMAWREFIKSGIDPFSDFSQILYSGFPQDAVVDGVLSGKVDSGTVRTGVLESLAQEGKINLSDIRILSQRDVPGFTYLLSTDLYPEWPFAKLTHASQDLAQKVVIQLLSMTPDHPVAQSGGYSGWTVPLDYLPVHNLLKELRISPYDVSAKISVSDIIEQYLHWALFALILLLIGLFWGVRVEYLVTKRTRELSKANDELTHQIAEIKRLEDIARKRQNELAHISRVNTIGELTASLAHEINQPLSAISNYAQGCVRRLKNLSGANDGESRDILDAMKRVASEAERASQVIKRIRELVRKSEASMEEMDISKALKDAVEIIQPEALRNGIVVKINKTALPHAIVADKIQIEQVLLNLIGNAMESTMSVSGPRTIIINTGMNTDGEAVVSIKDNGIGIGEKDAEQLFEAFYTTKTKGMGMGLSISRTIIETYGGRLWAEPSPDGGAIFGFSIPASDTIKPERPINAA
ncbi:MAG: PhnD/SsuA/transferrin family substrate-binding protein [Rhodospirillaceae bacterium]|nr:PhnD/SsuA/transferrin family substrate-binding protein [Rhodospirillaceae bacterium]